MRSVTEQKHEKPAHPKKSVASLRCCCGSLLARLVSDGIELKCRRCKRQVIVPFEQHASM
jgi:hypothetical protein